MSCVGSLMVDTVSNRRERRGWGGCGMNHGSLDRVMLSLVYMLFQIIASRVTPEAQNQLLFILKNVKLGTQRRYQIWFATR